MSKGSGRTAGGCGLAAVRVRGGWVGKWVERQPGNAWRGTNGMGSEGAKMAVTCGHQRCLRICKVRLNARMRALNGCRSLRMREKGKEKQYSKWSGRLSVCLCGPSRVSVSEPWWLQEARSCLLQARRFGSQLLQRKPGLTVVMQPARPNRLVRTISGRAWQVGARSCHSS
jgi:hypothetical protein